LLFRPPPSSTLFPYTTLFRSSPSRQSVRRQPIHAAIVRGPVVAEQRGVAEILELGIFGTIVVADLTVKHLGVAAARIVQKLLDLDRKSTRLNSSHVKISYAVF